MNLEAFKRWCKHKGASYKQQGKTLSANKMSKYSYEQQDEMVDTSIMNDWKGLFEPDKKSSKTKEPEVGSIAWRMKQEQEVIDVSDQAC